MVQSFCVGYVFLFDRFRQIEPRVLVMARSYAWGGVRHDRSALVQEVQGGLPSVRHLLLWGEGEAVEPAEVAVADLQQVLTAYHGRKKRQQMQDAENQQFD